MLLLKSLGFVYKTCNFRNLRNKYFSFRINSFINIQQLNIFFFNSRCLRNQSQNYVALGPKWQERTQKTTAGQRHRARTQRRILLHASRFGKDHERHRQCPGTTNSPFRLSICK